MFKSFVLKFECTGSLTMGLLHGEDYVYAHAYDDMEQAATDLNDFFSLEYSVEHWEGNLMDEDDFNPDDMEVCIEAERNGDAFWAMEIQQIIDSVQKHSWKNVQDFLQAWEALTV